MRITCRGKRPAPSSRPAAVSVLLQLVTMHSFRLGRLFGIDIRIDYSWLFIAVLLTWNLSSVFAGLHPDWPMVESIGIALLASLLFFGCIVLHELAHSLVAGRYGLRVRSITLFLFGGVSNIEHEPPSARAEFFMAIAGPISSILLGFVFLFLAQASATFAPGVSRDLDVSRALAGLDPITTLLAWLGPINLVIGVFNLVPAFPLDGGRVLRSILWGASGNLHKSTRRVSALGQVFGWFFIVTGIAMAFGVHILFFGTGLVGGLWLAFIGWFLHSAAVQSYTRLAVDEDRRHPERPSGCVGGDASGSHHAARRRSAPRLPRRAPRQGVRAAGAPGRRRDARGGRREARGHVAPP